MSVSNRRLAPYRTIKDHARLKQQRCFRASTSHVLRRPTDGGSALLLCGSMGVDWRATSLDPRLSVSIHLSQVVQAGPRARRPYSQCRRPHTNFHSTRDSSGSRNSVPNGATWRRVAANPAQRHHLRQATAHTSGDQRFTGRIAHGAALSRQRPWRSLHAAEHY